MDWTWAIGIPLLLMAVLCPLMMIAMMFGGWIFGRRAMGGGHGSHGMMMCMGHGSHADENSHAGHEIDRQIVIDELKAERERLDQLIAAEEKHGH